MTDDPFNPLEETDPQAAPLLPALRQWRAQTAPRAEPADTARLLAVLKPALAAQTRARKGSIADGTDAQRFGPHTAKLLRAAKGSGLDARASRDAGSYLCNYLSWRAIEAVNADSGPRLAAFVHIPPLARGGAVRRKGFPRITLEELVDAGEAMLLEMVRLARRVN